LNCKYHILFLISCLIGFTAFSQNIEFVENRGQWDASIRFRGDVGGGSFYVTENGFTVLQHHPEDWGVLS
jgi:hypothetical protein